MATVSGSERATRRTGVFTLQYEFLDQQFVLFNT